MSDDDTQPQTGDQEPPPAGEEPEPPPAGEEPEPAPAGEEPEPPPEGEEPPPADSPADHDSDEDEEDDSGKKKKDSFSDNGDSSSSGDSSSASGDTDDDAPPSYSVDDVQAALTAAFRNHGIDVGSGDISVAGALGGNMKIALRLSGDAMPLPLVPQSTPDPVTPAEGLVEGMVQLLKGMSRVILHVVIVQTSEIAQSGEGTASGDSVDTVQAAAEDALAALTTLRTT